MTVENLRTGGVTYAPVSESFVPTVAGEDIDAIRSDAAGWAAAIRETTQAVGPDWVVMTGCDSLFSDITTDTGFDDRVFVDDVTGRTEVYAETLEMVAETFSGPIMSVLPAPVTIATQTTFGQSAQTSESTTSQFLDTIYDASMLLTDVMRRFGETVDGYIFDLQGLQRAKGDDSSITDIHHDSAPVFNLADHYSVPVLGRLASPTEQLIDTESYAAVLYDELPPEMAEATQTPGQDIGGGFPERVWSLSEDRFESQVKSYIEAAPPGFVFSPRIPDGVPPERVATLSRLVSAFQ